MNDRAMRGGGQAVPLINANAGNGSGIVTGTGADWFGPGNPMTPVAPPETAGRILDYMPATNLQYVPKAFEGISFGMLRALSRSYDVLRLVIETRKDQLVGLEWSIMPKDRKAKLEGAMKTTVDNATAFFQKPDKKHKWETWLRLILEDLLVLDAPAIYRRKTRGGGLYALRPIDGGKIKRVIDDWGDTPDSPAAAYQHILRGLPAVNYTVDDLIYEPRNPANDRIYGYGPVEMIVAIVNIALQRESWQISFFTDGNIPQALIGVPDAWSGDQIRKFQEWFDGALQGNTQRRQGAIFVPGASGKNVTMTKETELFGAAEEWMARVVCYAFSVSPQWATKMMNRSTASTAKQMAEEEGLVPYKIWIKGLIDSELAAWFSPDIEFIWNDEEDLDPAVQDKITDAKIKRGQMTLNAARIADGEDPYGSDVPEADRPMIYTATGVVPLAVQDQIDAAKDKAEQIPPPPQPVGGAPGAQGDGNQEGGTPKPGANPAPKPAAKHAHDVPRIDRPFVSKADKTSVNRALAKRAQASIQRTITAAFAECADDVAAQVEKALKVTKADDPQPDVNALVNNLDLSALVAVASDVGDDLASLSADTATTALAMVGVTERSDLVDQVNVRAVAFAKERAAELVGKRWMPDGSLIDNPNAKWAITDSTRDMLRTIISDGLEENIGTPAIAEAIQDGTVFSKARAKLVAHTEVANANEQSKLIGWRVAGENGVVVKKAWLTATDPCDVCIDNEAAGFIDLDDDFPSGDDAAPAHPRCLIGESLVSATNILATSAREYRGAVTIVKTASGKQLTGTPNHPVLTRRGWVAASELKVTDQVVSYVSSERAPLGDVDHQNVEASIQDIAESFGGSGRMSPRKVKLSTPDFHGDGAGSDVAIIRTDWELTHGIKAEFDEDFKDRGFGPDRYGLGTDDACPLDLLLFGLNPTARSHMRGHGLPVPLNWSSLLPEEEASRAMAAPVNSALPQYPRDWCAADVEAFCKSLFGFAGKIAFDNVVSVESGDFSGHVYNLQTFAGMYAANGIVTSNCECVTISEVQSDE